MLLSKDRDTADSARCVGPTVNTELSNTALTKPQSARAVRTEWLLEKARRYARRAYTVSKTARQPRRSEDVKTCVIVGCQSTAVSEGPRKTWGVEQEVDSLLKSIASGINQQEISKNGVLVKVEVLTPFFTSLFQ